MLYSMEGMIRCQSSNLLSILLSFRTEQLALPDIKLSVSPQIARSSSSTIGCLEKDLLSASQLASGLIKRECRLVSISATRPSIVPKADKLACRWRSDITLALRYLYLCRNDFPRRPPWDSYNTITISRTNSVLLMVREILLVDMSSSNNSSFRLHWYSNSQNNNASHPR